MTNLVPLRIALLVAIVAAQLHQHVIADEPKDARVITVHAEDIPDKVRIVGKLGMPIGTLLTIRGQWISPGKPAKDPGLLFIVEVVNGQTIAEPIRLHVSQVGQIFPHRKGQLQKRGETWDWKVLRDRGDDPPPKPVEGEVWEISGVETGHLEDYSSAIDEIWGFPGAHSRMGRGWYMTDFHTRFEFIAIKRLK